MIKNKKSGENGDRTHAELPPVDLKSTALTTRPSRLIEYNILHFKILFSLLLLFWRLIVLIIHLKILLY